MATPKIKLGEARDLQLSSRFYQFSRSHAMHDVFDALVELITNADDSYHRLFVAGMRADDGGNIVIEYLASKDNPQLAVYDHAQGMSMEEMAQKLGDVGTRRSAEGDRGFMSRGAKDCSELGNVVFESIKNDQYSRCELTQQAKFIPVENGTASRRLRERLHIARGNGTVVTLQLDAARRLPRFETLVRDLPRHFALRDVLSETSPSTVYLRNLNKDQMERLVYRTPIGEVVHEEEFQVDGYGVSAKLRIIRAPEPFEDSGERFRRSGILVKGSRAIHECSLLSSEFERDILARRYFGRLECDYIDKLLTDFDRRREHGESPSDENPSLLVDPNRQAGLERSHPFTKALFLIPQERLRALIAAERESQRTQRKEIANRDMQVRLSKLARKASEFLKQQLEDMEPSPGTEINKSVFSQALSIFPPFLNMGVDQVRNLTLYVKSSRDVNPTVRVTSDNESALSVLDPNPELHPHKSKEDWQIAVIRVQGNTPKEKVVLRACAGELQEAMATISVKDATLEQRMFDNPVEFEFDEYKVRDGSRRTLQLYAKFPEVVADSIEVVVESSDPAGVPVRGNCVLTPVSGSNYAVGAAVVLGRKLHSAAHISAFVNGRTASTQVRVVQQPPEEGIPVRIELRDEDYGKFRARWADHEGKPNLLLVSARHKSLSRYLGPPPTFDGQNSALFRVLLAEIVAESVARKALVMESKERTWEFRWADLKEDHLIADDVFAHLQQRIRDFVADAHAIMLSDADVRREMKSAGEDDEPSVPPAFGPRSERLPN